MIVEGVTVVFGNSNDVKKLGTNAKCILRTIGERDIPIFLGETGPLVVSGNLTLIAAQKLVLTLFGDLAAASRAAAKYARCSRYPWLRLSWKSATSA